MSEDTNRILVGIDVGFNNTGVVVAYRGRKDIDYQVVDSLCVKTQPNSKKKGIYVSHDDVRRCQETITAVHSLLSKYATASAMAVEIPNAGARNGRAARTMGITTGMIATYVKLLDIPVVWVMPDHIKKQVGGSGSASKVDIQKAILERYPNYKWPVTVKSRFEHIADAMGALIVAETSEIFKILFGGVRNVLG